MTTKERIIEEALTLFSVKGYKGTSVKNIADAVGIKDSSLYKHFKSKQEILDTIVAVMRKHVEDMSDSFGLPKDDLKGAASVYAGFDQDMLVEFSKKIFLFYLKDPFVSRFWRMGNIEQFQNPEVYAVFRKFFLEDSINYQTELFKELVEMKVFIDIEPSVIALSFYSPIFFLLSKYSNQIDKEEEALELIEKQTREFYRIYKRRKIK